MQVHLLVCEVEPAANVEPVKINRAFGHTHQFGDLFRGFALADQVGHLGFHRRQVPAIDDKPPVERRCDVVYAALDGIQQESLARGQFSRRERGKVWANQIIEVANDLFFELATLIFNLVKQHLQRGVGLFQSNRARFKFFGLL